MSQDKGGKRKIVLDRHAGHLPLANESNLTGTHALLAFQFYEEQWNRFDKIFFDLVKSHQWINCFLTFWSCIFD